MSFEGHYDEYFPRGPGHLSSCHGHAWPFKGYWGFPPRNPINDVTYFREAIEDIIKNMIRRGELQPGPSAPGQIQPFPLIGVTNGSNAGTGIVGEFINFGGGFSYQGNPNTTTTTVSAGVVPPGDWDLWAWLWTSNNIGGGNFYLNPLPAGISHTMGAVVDLGSTAQVELEMPMIVGPVARASLAVPTLLSFTVFIDQRQAANLIAGTGTVQVHGRRVR